MTEMIHYLSSGAHKNNEDIIKAVLFYKVTYSLALNVPSTKNNFKHIHLFTGESMLKLISKFRFPCSNKKKHIRSLWMLCSLDSVNILVVRVSIQPKIPLPSEKSCKRKCISYSHISPHTSPSSLKHFYVHICFISILFLLRC